MTPIKCVVLCGDSNGFPTFVQVLVDGDITGDDVLDGRHYDAAKDAVADCGYNDPMIAFDENDPAGQELFPVMSWIHEGILTACVS